MDAVFRRIVALNEKKISASGNGPDRMTLPLYLVIWPRFIQMTGRLLALPP